jgi:hypothetical protein
MRLYLATENRNSCQSVCTDDMEITLQYAYHAHRYDLLCIEGISRALKVFLGKAESPTYNLVYPEGGEDSLLTVTVSEEVRHLLKNLYTACLNLYRRNKSDLCLLVQSFAMSNLLRAPMPLSWTCRINCIKTSAEGDNLLLLARTTLTLSRVLSVTRLEIRIKSNLRR